MFFMDHLTSTVLSIKMHITLILKLVNVLAQNYMINDRIYILWVCCGDTTGSGVLITGFDPTLTDESFNVW